MNTTQLEMEQVFIEDSEQGYQLANGRWDTAQVHIIPSHSNFYRTVELWFGEGYSKKKGVFGHFGASQS